MRPRRASLAAVGAVLLVAGLPTARLHAAPPLTRTAPAAPQRDPSCFTIAWVPVAGAGLQRIPRTFVRAGTDSVWARGGPLRRGLDYQWDLLRGDLRLLRSWVPGDTLWVSGCGLVAPPPLDFQRLVYRAARPTAPVDSSLPVPRVPLAANLRPATARDPASAPLGAALAVTGNKTLAVDFGSSQDAALRQSLDLSVSGHIAPGVELTGVLTDRDTPLSASGATQDLQSIDRVLLELRARDGKASLGDIPLAVTRGEFARLERRVQGVSGTWRAGPLSFEGAAAGSQGEYTRMQFAGVEGRQGPYELTDRDGALGISVVPGSEQVMVDGQRMTRGEAADYAIDYERARLTFSNRRPISAASRITVEYQYALQRFRRNIVTAASEWRQGAWLLNAQAISEGDDAGRLLTGTLDAADRVALAAAGDSLALGTGVLPGVGDYDSVRVANARVYAFAGVDSGAFTVRFARVGAGRGDYADSARVGGRTIFRYVGPGLGAYRIGRSLPAPESHRLATFGASTRLGALTLEAEGALSRLDRNTLSVRDAADDGGGAGRLRLGAEGRLGRMPGRAGFSAAYRAVEQRFAPFSRLERAFAEEDWGLSPGADLEHPKRADLGAFWQHSAGREVRAEWSTLRTPEGYAGTRRVGSGRWQLGALAADAAVLDAGGRTAGRSFGEGGRTRTTGQLRWNGGWWVPALRAERDRRRTPADSARIEDRVSALDAEVAGGTRSPWRWLIGAGDRRDARAAGLRATRTKTRTWRAELETPMTKPFGVTVSAQRRDTRDETQGGLVRQDLASTRLRGEWRPAGLSGALQIERTGEAENRRVRTLRFVGAGQGTHDATGNFVGTGDYDLVLVVTPDFERFARTATSARAAWAFGSSESWRGSRLEFTLEDEARRKGGGRLSDVFLSTGLALVDPGLARGTILQRLEAELAPGSRAAAFRARAERRVNADRSFENFAQTTDQRSGSLRWRLRPGVTTSAEAEARIVWQRAAQSFAAGASFGRTLVDQGGNARVVWQPGPAVRATGVLDLSWSRALGGGETTRTLRLGPEASLGVGRAGRADLSARRAFSSGPPALGLLPSAEPAGAPRWELNGRFDYRVHETTTIGFDTSVRERPGRRTVVTGRAEVRAFF